MKKIIVLLLTVFMVIGLTGCAKKEEKQPKAEKKEGRTEVLEISLGCQGDLGYGDALGDFYTAFSDYITEKTNGMIKFVTYPSGQLGSEGDMLQQILSDNLDGGWLSINVLATVWQDLYLFSLPFAFNTEDDYWAMMEDSTFRAAVEKTIEGTGLVKFLSPANAYFRGMQNKVKEVRTVSDLKGLKLRVMAGEIYSDIYQSLGCATSTVSMGELYSALQQGVVEAEDMNFTMFQFLKYYETEKYMTELNAMVATNPLIISNTVWEKLTDDEKKIFEEACVLGEEASKKAFLSYKDSFYTDLAKEGVNIIMHDELTADAIKGFQDATANVWTKYEAKVSKDFYKAFMDARAKVVK